jgi:hypothetical protein
VLVEGLGIAGGIGAFDNASVAQRSAKAIVL